MAIEETNNYFNRELGHLWFNLRVLEQAKDERHPLLERLFFLQIFSSNLDEFFEIRVSDLRLKIELGEAQPGHDGMSPDKVMEEISRICHEAVDRQYSILNDELLPKLEEEGIYFLARSRWTEEQKAWIRRYFREQIRPVLTPIAIDLAHPFPRLVNKSLNFIVPLKGKDAFGRQSRLAIVPAPRSLPRVIRLPDHLSEGRYAAVFLSSMIHDNVSDLFPGMEATACYQFRCTRNADLHVDDTVDDLAAALKGELFSRRYGDEVRLEISNDCPRELIDFLLQQFELSEQDLYLINGPVNLTRIQADVEIPELRYQNFKPRMPAIFYKDLDVDVFTYLENQDLMLHHPFESFSATVSLLRRAVRDPNVLAIKQTIYRVGIDSEIIDLLVEAAWNGKEVTVVIELLARFDEESNIEGARRLQEAGAIVVYGVVGYKTHSKMMLIVRQEGRRIKRYVHLATGNYHSGTSRVYTDWALMTADREITDDVHKIFHTLTGMGKAVKLKKIMTSPFLLHKGLLELIEEEIKQAEAGKPAKIIVKTNAVTEKQLIDAFYRASQAGVTVQLIVRSVCCLVPGVKGLSDNVEVRSVVGRFLEHHRVYYFHAGGEEKVYCSSADLMDRNMHTRVETCFPILDEKNKKRVIEESLTFYLKDNCQSWKLHSNGEYTRNSPNKNQQEFSAQEALLEKLCSFQDQEP